MAARCPRGVDQDYQEAMKKFRLAAEQNVPEAWVNIGVFYLNGLGVPTDTTEAAVWIRRAQKTECQWHCIAAVMDLHATAQKPQNGIV